MQITNLQQQRETGKHRLLKLEKEQIISSGPQPLNFYVIFFCEEMWREKMIAGDNGEAGSCSSGCDVILCKLGPLHSKRLLMLENTHYGNQFNEPLNSFIGFMRI